MKVALNVGDGKWFIAAFPPSGGLNSEVKTFQSQNVSLNIDPGYMTL
jgi:hypothetical protein